MQKSLYFYFFLIRKYRNKKVYNHSEHKKIYFQFHHTHLQSVQEKKLDCLPSSIILWSRFLGPFLSYSFQVCNNQLSHKVTTQILNNTDWDLICSKTCNWSYTWTIIISYLLYFLPSHWSGFLCRQIIIFMYIVPQGSASKYNNKSNQASDLL